MHFLNQVDEADLFALMDEDQAAAMKEQIAAEEAAKVLQKGSDPEIRYSGALIRRAANAAPYIDAVNSIFIFICYTVRVYIYYR